MNNAPDYNDNLAFEPKKTYEDVFKLAVDKYGYKMCCDDDYLFITKHSYTNGRKWLFNNDGLFIVDYYTIKSELSPEKMKQLILALE